MQPETLLEAVRYFSDLEVCNAYMRRIKWPNGKITCPHCDSDRIGEIATRHLLRCKACRKQFSYKVGTIFEDSPLGLDKWFVAVWAIANCRNGISSHELARALGVTQKTAWFMLHRIRLAMECESFDSFDGPSEADTTYVGGKAENMHAKRREKAITGRGTVDHSAGEYVVGEAHTNGAENFWSLLKRALKGTYVAVSPFHLFRYVEEQAFRFNHRLQSDFERFHQTLAQVVGKRLTYRVLGAVGDAGFMGIQ